MAKGKDIFQAISIATVIVILTVIAALVVSTVLNNSVFTDITTTGTNTNETLTAVDNVTNSTFAIISTQPSATCTLTSLVNATGAEAVAAGNYTFYTNCNLILADDSEYIGEDLNVTYSYSHASGTSLAGVNATRIQADFGSFVTNMIAFLAVIGTIIGIIWLLLYVRRLFDKKEGLNGITA